MKRSRVLVGLCLLLLSGLAVADSVAKQLEANYSQMEAAFRRKDLASYMKFYAPDYTALDLRGTKSTLEKVASSLNQQMATTTNVEWSRKVGKVTVAGNLATANVSGHFKATAKGPDGKFHKLEVTSVAVNLWVKNGKQWLLKSAKVQDSTIYQDGKKIVLPPLRKH